MPTSNSDFDGSWLLGGDGFGGVAKGFNIGIQGKNGVSNAKVALSNLVRVS
jgi:hypothetical protein